MSFLNRLGLGGGQTKALFQLVKEGKADELRTKLQSAKLPHGLDDLHSNKQGHTLLQKAVRYLQPRCVEVLLQLGASCAIKDSAGRTAFHLLVVEAAARPQQAASALAVQHALLNHVQHNPGILREVDVFDKEGTPLLLALAHKQEPLVHGFLAVGFRVNVATQGDKSNALHLAVLTGNPDLVTAVLRAAEHQRVLLQIVNQPNMQGVTALHAAVSKQMLPTVHQLLYLLYINTDLPDCQGNTPLHIALQAWLSEPANHPTAADCVARLLARDAGIDLPNRAGLTAVAHAVDLAMLLLEGGLDAQSAGSVLDPLTAMAAGKGKLRLDESGSVFNMPSAQGCYAVHVAAQLGDTSMLSGLINRGADINLQDARGRLASVLAAEGGHKSCVVALFGPLGADPLAMDANGVSAVGYLLLHPTPHCSHSDLRDVLLMAVNSPCLSEVEGPSLMERLATQPVTSTGITTLPGPQPLLHLACAVGSLDVVKVLVEDAGIPADVHSNTQQTPLSVTVAACCSTPAAAAKYTGIAEFLVQQGASPVARDQAGVTPLGRALDEGLLDLVMAMLRHARSYVDFKSPTGTTALYLAILHGNRAAVEELVTQLGANLGPQQRFTPLHLAVGCLQPYIVQQLLTQQQVLQGINQPDCHNITPLGYLWTAWRPDTLSDRHRQKLQRTQRSGSGSSSWNGSSSGRPTSCRDPAAAQAEMAQLLLQQPQCDPNLPDATGKRLLHLAVEHNRVMLIEVVARTAQRLDPNLPDADGVTPLYRAVSKGDLQLVETLMKCLPQLDTSAITHVASRQAGGNEQHTALHAAIKAANPGMVALLVKQPDTIVDTLACKMALGLLADNPAAAEPILTQLLHPSLGDRCTINFSPKATAAQGTAMTLSLNLPGAAGAAATTGSGPVVEVPVLHYVAALDKPLLVKLLCHHAHASVEEVDARGMTPLHHAIAWNAVNAASALIKLGADVSALGTAPTTPLIAAVASQQPHLVALLLDSPRPFDINVTDRQGHSALSMVAHALLEWSIRHPQESQPHLNNYLHRGSSGASGASGDFGADQLGMLSPGNGPTPSTTNGRHPHLPPLTPNSAASLTAWSQTPAPGTARGHSLGIKSTTSTSATSVASSLLSAGSTQNFMEVQEVFKMLVSKGADVNQTLPEPAVHALHDVAIACRSQSLVSSPGRAVPTPQLASQHATPLLLAVELRAEHALELLLQEGPASLDMNGSRSVPALQLALQHVACTAEEVKGIKAQGGGDDPASRKLRPEKSIFGKSKKLTVAIADIVAVEATYNTAVRIFMRLASDPGTDLSAPFEGCLLIHLVEMGLPDGCTLAARLLQEPRPQLLSAVDSATGRTALHVAAARNDAKMCEVLAAAEGVNFNVLDKQGHTPLAAAVQAGAKDAINVVLQHGLSNEHAVAPLDPLMCGADPATSPMALAIADTQHRSMHALIAGLQSANAAVSCAVPPSPTSSRPFSNGKPFGSSIKSPTGTQPSTISRKPSVNSRLEQYDVQGVLNSPVDCAGRPPVLVAAREHKLDALQELVKAGAALNVSEPDRYVTKPGGTMQESDRPKATPLHIVLESIISLEAKAAKKEKATAKETVQLITWASVIASDMASAPSMATAVGMQDAVGFTPLHWAVMARRDDVVQILCPKARKLGSINAAAKSEQGRGFTALHLAAQLDQVHAARCLLAFGADGEAATAECMTPLLLSKSEEMRVLIQEPPAPLAPNNDTAPAKVSVGRKVASGYDNLKGNVVYVWNQLKGVDVKVKEPLETSYVAEGLYGSIYVLTKMVGNSALAASKALGPVGIALAATCSLAQLLMDNMERVIDNNMLVMHMCGRIRRQVPTLQSIKTTLEQSQNEEAAQQLLPHVANLGEVYIKVHKMVDEWVCAGRVSMVTRILSSREFYQAFLETERTLTGCMTDLGTAANALQLMGITPAPECDPEQALQDVKAAIRQDMQAAMRHIMEAEAVSTELEQHHAAAVALFKEYGLDFKQLRRREYRTRRGNMLRGLRVDAAHVQIMSKIGTGGSAQVYLAMYQGFPVAYKLFEALPAQEDVLRRAVDGEAYVMSTLRHPNVIQIYGVVSDKDTHQFGLLVDYHAPGSLQDIINARMHRGASSILSIQERVILALQIARGMAYLHGRSMEPIVHGDLKPSNVLISEDGRAVITDFGMSRVTSNTTTTTGIGAELSDSFTSNASAVYTAPEVVAMLLQGKKRQRTSDVFSFGVLCLELLTLKPCYAGFAANPNDWVKKVAQKLRPTVPADLPPVLRECIEACWDHDPAKRPSFARVVTVLDAVYEAIVGAA